jgi:hypothetical protein
MGAGGCGCQGRQSWLNNQIPGLGDRVKRIADPVAAYWTREEMLMPDILKPDLKALAWLAIGAFVLPIVITKLKG